MEQRVKSAFRVLQILELFDRCRVPMAMSDIALALDYPLSSTSVLLKTLVRSGYLNFDRQSRKYFPTTRVSVLGDWVPEALFGSSRVLDAMHDLFAATGEGVGVNVKNDIYVQYLQNVHSIHPLRFVIETGSLRLITLTGIGWTLLSTLNDDQIDKHVRRANIVAGPSGRIEPGVVIAKAHEIQRSGYCYVEDKPFAGGATLTALIPMRIGEQPVALSLGGALARMRENKERYLRALMDTIDLLRTDRPENDKRAADGATNAPSATGIKT